jgi:hypothetical protein
VRRLDPGGGCDVLDLPIGHVRHAHPVIRFAGAPVSFKEARTGNQNARQPVICAMIDRTAFQTAGRSKDTAETTSDQSAGNCAQMLRFHLQRPIGTAWCGPAPRVVWDPWLAE